MTDILSVLPNFDIQAFSNLVPSLERHKLSLSDILTCDPVDVARRAQVPAREIRRLTDATLYALHQQLGILDEPHPEDSRTFSNHPLLNRGHQLVAQWRVISLLDENLDTALGGGVPAGYLTEITGERSKGNLIRYANSVLLTLPSGVGKTQLLLTLLLAVQLPPPLGLSRSAIYISTEAPLPTSRLSQLLSLHPRLNSFPVAGKPSLSKILALQTPDLESQDHILRFQLPVAITRYNVGLVVIDSITANYRAEFDLKQAKNETSSATNTRQGLASMARRSAQLLEIGTLLRNIAQKHDVAVVVANQVSDRFVIDHTREMNISSTQPPQSGTAIAGEGIMVSELLLNPETPSASEPSKLSKAVNLEDHACGGNRLTLDHQQRFFTGWGASPSTFASIGQSTGFKTPSLGLIWTNQVACRVVLTKLPCRKRVLNSDEITRWKRHLKVVFASWTRGEEGNQGTEFVIEQSGLRSLRLEIERGRPWAEAGDMT